METPTNLNNQHTWGGQLYQPSPQPTGNDHDQTTVVAHGRQETQTHPLSQAGVIATNLLLLHIIIPHSPSLLTYLVLRTITFLLYQIMFRLVRPPSSSTYLFSIYFSSSTCISLHIITFNLHTIIFNLLIIILTLHTINNSLLFHQYIKTNLRIIFPQYLFLYLHLLFSLPLQKRFLLLHIFHFLLRKVISLLGMRGLIRLSVPTTCLDTYWIPQSTWILLVWTSS
jgi:hypothetical protein